MREGYEEVENRVEAEHDYSENNYCENYIVTMIDDDVINQPSSWLVHLQKNCPISDCSKPE